MPISKKNKETLTHYSNRAIVFSPIAMVTVIEMLEYSPENLLFFLYTTLAASLVYFLVLVMNIEVESLITSKRKEYKPLKDVATYALSSYLVVFIYSVGSDSIAKDTLLIGHILCSTIIVLYSLVLLFFEANKRKIIEKKVQYNKQKNATRISNANRARAKSKRAY